MIRNRTSSWAFASLAGVILLGFTLAYASSTLADPAAAGKRATVMVKGLACPFCVYGLEKHLRRLPGATHVQVELGKSKAAVDFSADSRVTDEQIKKAVADAGFTTGEITWSEPTDKGKPSVGGQK